MLKRPFALSDLAKNSITLVFGAVLAQVIPFVIHPYLRRVYSVEDYGAMSVFLNLFAVLSIVSALRYEVAIVLPKKNSEAANVLSLTIVVNLLFALVIFMSLLFFKNCIAALFNFPKEYVNYLFFLPATVLMFGICQSVNAWLVREKAFKASSLNKIVRRLVEGGTQAVLGFFRIPGGLFTGDLLGHLSNLIVGVKQLFSTSFSKKEVSVNEMVLVGRKYSEYPKYNTIPTLLSSLANAFPFLIVSSIYSTEIVGYLDLTRLVLSIPAVFISAAVSQVLFQRITQKKHEMESVKHDLRNVFFILLVVIVIELILVLFYAPEIFSFIFGEKYRESGSFSQLLVFSFIFMYISSAFSSVFMTFDKIKMNSIWQVVYFAAISSLWFIKDVSVHDFLRIYVAIETLMHLSQCIMIYFIVQQYEHKIAGT